MLIGLTRLKELIAALDEARRVAAGPGQGCYCENPHVGPDGKDYRWEPKPYSVRPTGHVYPDGSTLELIPPDEAEAAGLPGGTRGVRVSLGRHGRGVLGIDPETGEVHCTACEAVKEV